MSDESSRRKFLGNMAVAAGATAGFSTIASSLFAQPDEVDSKIYRNADDWFKQVKGSHRVVIDAPQHHNGFPFIWSWVFYTTNNQTGSTDSDLTSVVVMRHDAAPFGLKDSMWEKYKLGEVLGVNDPITGKPATRNLYYEPKEGDFPLPAIEGIRQQQARGAMYCVCGLAIKVDSRELAKRMGLDPDEAEKDWLANIHPGIQVMPSGVWALGRAQENKCSYIFAG